MKPLQICKCSIQLGFYEGKYSLLPKLIKSEFIQGEKKSETIKLKESIKLLL